MAQGSHLREGGMIKSWIKVLVLGLGLLWTVSVAAQVHVRGYYKKNGTYVAPHYRSSPNSSRLDNWSTKGNANPYTGKPGTRNPYPTYTAPTYRYTPPAYPQPTYPPPINSPRTYVAPRASISASSPAARSSTYLQSSAMPQGEVHWYRCDEPDGSYRYSHQPSLGCIYLGSGVVQRGR